MYETRNETTNLARTLVVATLGRPLLDSTPAMSSPGQCAGSARGLKLDRG
jgi:hypothetical protein